MRYDARRAARGSVRQYAAGWTDAAAKAVFELLHAECKAARHAEQGGVPLPVVLLLAREVRPSRHDGRGETCVRQIGENSFFIRNYADFHDFLAPTSPGLRRERRHVS